MLNIYIKKSWSKKMDGMTIWTIQMPPSKEEPAVVSSHYSVGIHLACRGLKKCFSLPAAQVSVFILFIIGGRGMGHVLECALSTMIRTILAALCSISPAFDKRHVCLLASKCACVLSLVFLAFQDSTQFPWQLKGGFLLERLLVAAFIGLGPFWWGCIPFSLPFKVDWGTTTHTHTAPLRVAFPSGVPLLFTWWWSAFSFFFF